MSRPKPPVFDTGPDARVRAVGSGPFAHRTVLLDEAVDGLAIDGPRRDGRYVDCTFGRGGHSRLILERLGADGRLLAFDRDPEAIADARRIDDPRFAIAHERYTALEREAGARGFEPVDGVLFDLGISSPQIDDATRGFSFRHDGPLDMRMDPTRGASAADWLNSAPADDIERVIRDHGEERFAFSIAQAVVARRAEQALSSTRELAELVAATVPPRRGGKSRKDATQDPATRTFQAVRIHVNQELEELEAGLSQAMDLLAPGGRLAVIAFHSLEDRIVKRFIARQSAPEATLDATARRLPIRAADLPQPALIAVARIKPGAAEIAANPRSRSAVLRVAERTAAPRLPEAPTEPRRTGVRR